MSPKKIVIRLFYVLLLAILLSAGWTYNSIARAPQSSVYSGESINAAEPGLTIVPTLPMQTTELGGTASFTVALSSQPTDKVTVGLRSSDTTEGTITTASLVFPKNNWDSPKTVTVTGVDDFVVDGDVAYNIVLDPITSKDPLYNGLPEVNVGLINLDDENAGLTIVTTPPMETSEAGGTASFTVALSSQPIDTVTVALVSDTPAEGIVTQPLTPTLTFTVVDWDIPQPVTVTGVDDSIVDNIVAYNIVLNPDSVNDFIYKALPDVNVAVTNTDRLSVVTPPQMHTTESGGTASFNVALSSQPTQNVEVVISSDMLTEGIITSPATPTLTFTTTDWNIPKPFTVSGVSDCQDDGDKLYSLTFSSTSLDPVFNVIETLPLINYGAPTIGWVKPVGTEGIHFSDGLSPIPLEVVSLCPEPIGKVRFYRWVEALQDWETIGDDSNQPYEVELLASKLEPGWNQVFAFAFSPVNGVQTFSKHVRILIRNEVETLILLPLVKR
jgi:hypothetical protein